MLTVLSDTKGYFGCQLEVAMTSVGDKTNNNIYN